MELSYHYTPDRPLRKMALPHRGRRRFTPTGIFPMLQTLFEAITPCAKTLYEKWRCRIAAGGVSRRQTFFQCFKLCLKLSYHTRKANLCEKWRCRFAAGGVSRRQAFFQCFKLCLKLLYRSGKTDYFYTRKIVKIKSIRITAKIAFLTGPPMQKASQSTPA